jgi:CubicO group peptidase (beta-lactamase class C family)
MRFGKNAFLNIIKIALIGFAIQHAYEKKLNSKIDYNDILEKYIIQKIGMPSFSPWKPMNGKYNTLDSIAPYIVGSPAGGYWMTAEDLAKFAQWIYQKAMQDAKFKTLLEKYGQEFYYADREVIAHGGAISSSSGFLSVSLKTGATIAILSDQPSGMSSDMNLMIQEHIFSKKIAPAFGYKFK